MNSFVTVNDGRIIFSNLRIAKTFWQRFRGLMLKKQIDEQDALLIVNCNSVHCCFMRFAIDVLFLDSQGTVLFVVDSMKPWRFSRVVKGAKQVLECKAGSARKYGLCEGTRLDFHSG